MQRLILINLILLTACSDPGGSDQALPSQANTNSESQTPDKAGPEELTFEEIPTDAEFLRQDLDVWDPQVFQSLELMEESSNFEPVVVPQGVHFRGQIYYPVPSQGAETKWRNEVDFVTDDGTDEYQVYQSLKQQLGFDRFRIRSTGVTGAKLKYEAECQGKRYEIEYDSRTVNIIKVTNIE